jgi:hypothetical protein
MSKPKKKLHEDLDKLLDFYSKQIDFVGGARRSVPVLFSPRELDRFAVRTSPGGNQWLYRGFTLTRAVGAKAA